MNGPEVLGDSQKSRFDKEKFALAGKFNQDSILQRINGQWEGCCLL